MSQADAHYRMPGQDPLSDDQVLGSVHAKFLNPRIENTPVKPIYDTQIEFNYPENNRELPGS